MTAIQEVVVTSCLNDSAVSVRMWDAQTGTSLKTYRGEIPVTSDGLSLLSAQYVVAALQDKPYLRVWPVNGQQPLSLLRLVCPGRVTHAQVSPDNFYIAVTVAEKLHVYQAASGRLVGTGARHFQAIRVVRWTFDGTLVVCGGEDGLVTVWPLANLATAQRTVEPRHVLSDHSLPVTDLVVTAGSRPRLLSVSADRTCKVYDLSTGTFLVSLVCDSQLTAVATSVLEADVFLGTNSGTILQFSLLSPPRHLEYHLTAEESAPVFTGHSKAIRTLSTSLNGDLVMSGSADGSVKIWHINSRQCLRTFNLKGPVTNAFFALKPKQLFNNELQPSVVINSFQTVNTQDSDCIDVITEESLALCDDVDPELFPRQLVCTTEERVKSLQIEIDLLKSINSNLYKFTVDKVIAGNAVVPHVSKVVMEPVKQKKKKKKRPKANVNGSVQNNMSDTAVVAGNALSERKRKKRKLQIIKNRLKKKKDIIEIMC